MGVAPMSVLVTGANGFVGLNLLERLLAAGRDVVSLSRRPIPAAAHPALAGQPGRLVEVLGDVRDTPLIENTLRAQDVSAVVHMAAITAAADREKRAADEVISVNLCGLASVMTASANVGVSRFVCAGSIAVYGGGADGSLLEEESPHAPRSLYAITKSAGDAVVARLGELHGLDWVIGRLGRVFGPYEYDTGVRDTMSQIYQVTQAAIAGRAVVLARPCIKNWNYSRDAAANLQALIDAPQLRHRIYNLGSPYAWSLAAWCESLARRYPDFSFGIGGGDGESIDLGGGSDGGLLSWQRFAAEFGATAQFDRDAAFNDYMNFIDQESGDVVAAPASTAVTR